MEKVPKNKRLSVYKTAGDYYQTDFVCFFDKLIDFESWPAYKNGYYSFATKWANLLLDKLDFLKTDEDNYEFFKYISRDITEKYYGEIKIDKIVGVTLSSHLLAEEIRDLYSVRLGLDVEEEPQVIKLTNYYEFYNEEPFEQIREGDNVIIVNDVISTGKLNSELYDSLTESGKKANVVAIFSLVDTRIKIDDYKANPDDVNRVTHYYGEHLKRRLVSILDFPITKYKSLDQIPAEIVQGRKFVEIKINSVLNAPAHLRKKSDEVSRKLLYNDSSADKTPYQFLKNIADADDSRKSLCIGHIESFGFHHPYFIDTNVLFKTESGKRLIEGLISDIKNQQDEIVGKRNRIHIFKISDRFAKLKAENPTLTYTQQKSIDYLLALTKRLKKSISGKENLAKLKFDFIIQASDSGIECIKRADFVSIFRKVGLNDRFQVIRMPRVMMNQKWGIPSIPDSYQYIFKGKTILILDSASCTGDTLFNLIDSMCYLDVGKITVLSVITRMKESYGEFLTRIYKIDNNSGAFPKSSIPIDVYFGAHLNLPFYLANSNQCPHCKEIHDYKEILYKTNPPKSVEDSITYSRYFLGVEKAHRTDFKPRSGLFAKYLMNDLDICKMFQIRDVLGKKEIQKAHNKFFKSDLIPNDFFDGLDSTIFDELIAVLLHEPHLIEIIRKEYHDLYYALKIIIDFNTLKFIPSKPQSKKFRTKLRLPWDKTSLLFVYSFFFEDEFFIDDQRSSYSDILINEKFLKSLLKYAEEYVNKGLLPTPIPGFNDEECLNLVAYLIWIRQIHPKIEQRNVFKLGEKSETLFIIINELRRTGKNNFKLQTRRLLNKLVFHLSLNRAIAKTISLGKAGFLLYKIYTNIETEGSNHGNLFQMVSDLGKALKDKNVRKITSLWVGDVRTKFQEILDVCEILRPAFEIYRQVSHYKMLFGESNSLTSSLSLMDELVEELKEKDDNNNLFTNKKIEILTIEMKNILNHFFEHNSQFSVFALNFPCNIVELWKDRCQLLTNLGFTMIDDSENGHPEKLLLNINVMLANYVMFNQLEVNLNSYAKENSNIHYSWVYTEETTELIIRNKKKSLEDISEDAIKSTYNGLENWKRLLILFDIKTSHTGLLSEQKWFETRFIFPTTSIKYE